DNSYSWCADGTGVRIYMIDTGVLPTNSEFAPSRVDSLPELKSYLASLGHDPGFQCWDPSIDDFGLNAMHGTATASIAGGVRFGVAKGATIVDARGATCGEIGRAH